jgi:hypothetical protein
MAHDEARQLIDLTQRLLDGIAAGDWNTYTELCDASLTAFEPESCGDNVRLSLTRSSNEALSNRVRNAAE